MLIVTTLVDQLALGASKPAPPPDTPKVVVSLFTQGGAIDTSKVVPFAIMVRNNGDISIKVSDFPGLARADQPIADRKASLNWYFNNPDGGPVLLAVLRINGAGKESPSLSFPWHHILACATLKPGERYFLDGAIDVGYFKSGDYELMAEVWGVGRCLARSKSVTLTVTPQR